jgi:hypothetical protein
MVLAAVELVEEYSKNLDERIKKLLFRDSSSNLIHCTQCSYTSQYNSAVKDHIEAKGRLQSCVPICLKQGCGSESGLDTDSLGFLESLFLFVS